MERKIQRESQKYIEKEFRKYDPRGTGAIPVSAMRKIVDSLGPHDEEELQDLIEHHLQESTYMELNRQTHQFDLKSEDNMIEFPSAMAIAVHFLKKQARRNTNEFSGKSLVRLEDMPKFSWLQEQMQQKPNRRLF